MNWTCQLTGSQERLDVPQPSLGWSSVGVCHERHLRQPDGLLMGAGGVYLVFNRDDGSIAKQGPDPGN